MYTILFYIIIGILAFDYLLERTLSILNNSHRNNILPKILADIYDPEKYKKSQEYGRINSKFSLISSSFSFLLILLILFFDGFALVDNFARSVSSHPIAITLIFFGILLFASDILGIPFDIYSTFVIEEKFGFNKTTPKIFIFDKLKGWLLSIVIGGLMLGVITWLYLTFKDLFWLYAWITISGFSVFMAMFYSSLIVPLFNKQTPLEEGELRSAIENFSSKVDFNLHNIFVIDGSKRSSKANAYFSGLGPKKRIVLYDTLIKDLEINELVAVLAHEIGHYKKKHIVSSIFLSILQTGFTLYIFSLLVGNPNLSLALGVEQQSFHIGLIAFGILYSPLSTILGLAMNVFSRKNEYQADHFAAKHELGNELISGLKKLSINSLSNLTPHPLFVFFNYSHPSLFQRITAILNYKKQ